MVLAAVPALRGEQVPVSGEALHYSINWSSGLSLGDAWLRAGRNGANWQFEFAVDAAVPGFRVADHYRSLAGEGLCSLRLEKGVTRGRRTTHERTSFDYRRNLARRVTRNGGRTEYSIGNCARDALAFVFHTRRELAAGRLPPASTIYFGAAYRVKLDYAGVETVKVSGTPVQADRMVVSLKGPASGIDFEVFYARDAARTPLLVKVPLSPGLVSMELVR